MARPQYHTPFVSICVFGIMGEPNIKLPNLKANKPISGDSSSDFFGARICHFVIKIRDCEGLKGFFGKKNPPN